ncbi:LysR substrate-binding domain-containing protein [Streptomyces ferralitis]|uniref:LysR substrate-binding domain-containing protein n=1 Tax=Streptantibioticus ferralitis TaxID=236510 RepID=A0ABT5Z0B9_9ACTN|nr:LysR substrate-binding domain-containing protein [Streptantibioticus ferralitis]MDF2256500.1 LysR substrate-binding domain-containing protein [Streptantibioticus ferralitis]
MPCRRGKDHRGRSPAYCPARSRTRRAAAWPPPRQCRGWRPSATDDHRNSPGQRGTYHRFVGAAGQHRASDLLQLLKLVELGELITLLPESVVNRYPRPGVVFRDVVDAPPAILVIAWPQTSRSSATAALVRAASAE